MPNKLKWSRFKTTTTKKMHGSTNFSTCHGLNGLLPISYENLVVLWTGTQCITKKGVGWINQSLYDWILKLIAIAIAWNEKWSNSIALRYSTFTLLDFCTATATSNEGC